MVPFSMIYPRCPPATSCMSRRLARQRRSIAPLPPATNDELIGALVVARPLAKAGLPHLVFGWPPIGALPSPPPCGWSRGFITEPRTVGRLPIWRLGRPCRSECSRDRRCRPGRASPCSRGAPGAPRPTACGPARSRPPWPSAAPTCRPSGPAGRPCLMCSSMLWICVPSGMFRSGSALPTRIGASGPGLRPCRRPSGRAARGCSASRRRRRTAARCAPSGSDRTRSPRPGPECPSLLRLKSMIR